MTDSTCSLTSLDVYDWVSDLKQIDLNEVHKSRCCELLFLAEKTFTTSARLKMIEQVNHADDVHVITLSSIYDFVETSSTPKIYIDEPLERIAKAACREAIQYSRSCDPIPTDLLVTLIKLKIIYIMKKDVYDATRIEQRRILFENPPPPVTNVKNKKEKAPKKTEKKSKAKKADAEEDICLPYLIQKNKTGIFSPFEDVTLPDKDLYFVLTGFYIPDIFDHLISAEMAPSCIIEFCEKSCPHGTSESELQYVLAHKHYTSQQFRNKNDTFYSFWDNLYDVFVRNKRIQVSNSFIVSYTPIVMIIDENEGVVANSQQVFEHFADAVHKIEEYRMWHENYLEKLRVLGLGETPEVIPAYCMDIYNEALDELPLECVSVTVVLEGLLSEVSHRVNRGKNAQEIYKSKLERRHSDFRDQLKKLFANLKFKNVKATGEFELVPTIKYALKDKSPILHEKNVLERNLHCYSNLHEALFTTHEKYLKKNACAELWGKYPSKSEFNNQLKELSSEVDLNPYDLQSCISVFLFGKIQCASEKKSVNEITAIEKCFPNRNNDLQMILKPEPEIIAPKGGFEEDSFNVYEQLLLHELTWIEDLSSTVFMQELNRALNKFECVDEAYVSTLESIHFHFHHNADEFGIASNNWGAKIRSPIDLNTFLNFVVHEDGEFVLEEQRRSDELEALYQEIVNKEMRRINQIVISDDEFILKGSVKDQLRQASLHTDEKKDGAKKGKKNGKGEKAKKDTKQSKSAATKSVRSTVESDHATQIDFEDVENAMNVKFPPRYLNAYDFEGRVAINGSTTTFYSLDPMRIIVDRQMLTGKPQRISVNLTMNGHSLMMHPYVHRGFEFHFSLKNGVTVVFGKKENELDSLGKQKNLQDIYLLSEKRIQSIKCINQDLILRRKLLVRAQYLKQIFGMINKAGKDEAGQVGPNKFKTLPSLKINRKQFLDELKQLKATTTIFNPRFKICSSRLHKYSHVKRVTSPVALQLQQISKFLNCTTDYERHKLVQVKKCFPIPNPSNPIEDHVNYDMRVTLENGLHVRKIPGLAPSDYHINQFYVKKGPQHVNIATEESRTFLRSGFVAVKYLDGTLKLYGGNGRIIKFDTRLVKHRPRKKMEMFQRKTKDNESAEKFLKLLRRQLRRRAENGKSDSLLTLMDGEMGFRLIATDGKRVRFKRGKLLARDCYYVFREDKIRERRSVYRRGDGVEIVLTHDGYVQVTYLDGTRVTTWFEVSSDTVNIDLGHLFDGAVKNMGAWVVIDVFYQFEHPHYATVMCSGTKNVAKVRMPGEVVLEHKGYNEYVLKMDEVTTAKISEDTVQMESLPCVECKKHYWCTFYVTQLFQLQKNISGEETLLIASDTYNKTFTVNYDGTCKRNDNYDRREIHCDHILHKRQNLQTFFVMKRDYSGQLIWTDQMYKDRLVESQLASNQTALFYVDQNNSTTRTVEFRTYEKERYYNRFSLPYLQTINPHQKEPPFDFSSGDFATQRLLRNIPDFRASVPLYMALINQLLVNDVNVGQLIFLSNYLATKSDLLRPSEEKTARVLKTNARDAFSKKIAQWRKQCEQDRKAIADFHTKPFYDFNFTTEPKSEDALSDQTKEALPLEEHKVSSFRTMGTNTLIPFCVKDQLKAQCMQDHQTTSSSSSFDADEQEPNMLKKELLDCISDILQNNYNINVDEDSESTLTDNDDVNLEEQSETFNFESEGSESDASSVPEFFKGENYRAAYKLFINPPTRKAGYRKGLSGDRVMRPSAICSNIDSIVTQADSWFSPEEDKDIPEQRTLSMKVLNSRIMHHPSYSNAELILKTKSSEIADFKQSIEEVGCNIGKTDGMCLDDVSNKRTPFIKQKGLPYKREHILD